MTAHHAQQGTASSWPDLPVWHAQVCARGLDNRELDKLVGALGRSKATWRRALLLHEWLLGMGHTPDDRLCTTLMRVCAQHGQVPYAHAPLYCPLHQGIGSTCAPPSSACACSTARSACAPYVPLLGYRVDVSVI